MLKSRKHLKVVSNEPKTCLSCVHAFVGVCGIFCLAFKEEVWSEVEGEHCEAHEA